MLEQATLKIYGIHSIKEALSSNKTIDKVYIQNKLSNDSLKEIVSQINALNIRISYVPIEKLNKLSKNNNHQGIVASISPIEFITLDDLIAQSINNNPIYLILDQLTDVRNFGAIARTAECCNVSGIIIPSTGSAPINSDAIKTSAGALYNIPICKVNHIKDAIYQLKDAGISLIAATEKTDTSLYDICTPDKIALVMGSEGKGVSKSVLSLMDHKAKLPMYGSISSLNVSVACGVFLYEIVRQRLKN